MKIQIIKTEDKAIALSLTGDFTIRAAAKAKVNLQKAIGSYQVVVLDLSKVAEFDSAAFQILLALKKSLTAQGKRLKLIKHSNPVLKIFDLYGAIGIFGDRVKIPNSERNSFRLAYGLQRDNRFNKTT